MLMPMVASKNYTPTLYELINSGFDPFDSPFGDWWDTEIPAHKEILCQKIIHTYFFNQICCDSPDRFKVYINAQLERIMPYYNQLYKSELIKINPLLTHRMVTNAHSYDKLVKLANTDRTSLGKALRDFVNSGRTTNDLSREAERNTTQDDTMHHSSTLDKSGQESRDEKRTEQESTGVVTDTTDNVHNDKKETKTVEFGKTVDKEGSGNKTTTAETTVTDSQTHTHSDTPQKAINEQGHEYVRLDYLTDYKTDTESSTTKANGTEKTDYKDNTTDGGTEKTTTTNDDTITDEKNVQEDTDRDLTVSDLTKTDWTEKDTLDESKTDNGIGHEVTKSDETGVDTTFNKGTSNDLTSDYHTSKETHNDNKETNEDTTVEGFSGISSSDLVKAFRDTFLNIDEMIIKDLRENFMEVY